MDEPIAYLKGQFVPASQFALPVYDLGIVLGAAVTHFLWTFHYKSYRMEQHVRQYYRPCKYARFELPVSLEDSLAVSEELLITNGKLVPGEELNPS